MDVSPRDLLAQATMLINSGAGRPRQSDLRRAISDCYYAVFHALTEQSADLLISGARRKFMRDYLRRGFEHRTMRNVCVRFLTTVDVRNAHMPIFKHLQLQMSSLTQGLRDISRGFLRLQNIRHVADYDHSLKFDKREVEGLRDLAQTTLDLVDGLDRTDDTHYAFLVALYAERATGTR